MLRTPLKPGLMVISMLLFMLAPAVAMSPFADKNIEIKAENAMFRGVDELEPDGKLILTVETVRTDREVTSAIKRSPSLLSGYADPVVVTGYVVTPADERLRHHKVRIRLPEQEWARIAAKAQDIIGIGIIDTDNGPGLLCLENLSSLDEKGEQAWLHGTACRKRWDK
ncbi:hypothetical protein FJU30_03945 [Affinibrenneria salicis]|uniref:Uncharacterized protein n=1 Tax=Affinibrenneria salicis TaxID=2590031 RepID=A0A5J5G7G3_9GAMM|nr:hypothetical protein [Affinibrenneria salicis]KAA9002575.1 hypothetical protein FJU30_00820 [Affinibrenneria salicis]KAA9003137.1 hypothetical protein FJU30_03945 [Affinibrenneria salicis]